MQTRRRVKKYTRRTHRLSRGCRTSAAENGPACGPEARRLFSLYRYDRLPEGRDAVQRDACILTYAARPVKVHAHSNSRVADSKFIFIIIKMNLIF